MVAAAGIATITAGDQRAIYQDMIIQPAFL
jgi:hypothetical protein